MNGKDRLLLAKLIYYVLSGNENLARELAKIIRSRFNLPKFESDEDFEDLREC